MRTLGAKEAICSYKKCETVSTTQLIHLMQAFRNLLCKKNSSFVYLKFVSKTVLTVFLSVSSVSQICWHHSISFTLTFTATCKLVQYSFRFVSS